MHKVSQHQKRHWAPDCGQTTSYDHVPSPETAAPCGRQMRGSTHHFGDRRAGFGRRVGVALSELWRLGEDPSLKNGPGNVQMGRSCCLKPAHTAGSTAGPLAARCAADPWNLQSLGAWATRPACSIPHAVARGAHPSPRGWWGPATKPGPVLLCKHSSPNLASERAL